MGEQELELKGKHCYRFETGEEESAVYKWAKEKQYTPLVFSRVSPYDVEEQHGIETADIVWLSSRGTPEIKSVPASEISKLTNEFRKLKEKTLVHFGTGALSFLISNNNFGSILRAFQYWGEEIATSDDCIMTAHINPKSFDEKELSQIYDTVPLLPLEYKEDEKKE